MDLASSKGSFRTAYNANKVISVQPYSSKTTNLIEKIRLKCEANRERETIDIMLNVNNAKIGV